MLVWENPLAIGTWVGEHGGGKYPPGSYSAIGYVENGELIGGFVFYNANSVNCFISLALSKGRMPRALLKAALYYAFKQLTLRRLTCTISSANIASQDLVTRLGAKREATLRDADPDGDLLVYALFPSECPLWSRFEHGKIR